MPHKATLLKILLSAYVSMGVASCPSGVKAPPRHLQCGYSVSFKKFRCCDSESPNNCVNASVDSPTMNGAQCLPINDEFESYRAMDDYVGYLKREARRRCK